MNEQNVYACKRSVEEFVKADESVILGEIVDGSGNFCILQTQRDAWRQEIELLKNVLSNDRFNKRENRIYFEFNLMRFAKRVDVVLILEGVLVCLEFKTDLGGGHGKCYSVQDKAQALAYADEFSQFHSTSSKCPIVPLLVVPGAAEVQCNVAHNNANVYELMCTNDKTLGVALSAILAKKDGDHWSDLIVNPDAWERGEYNTVPTIVEAAGRLFENQDVEDITRSGTDITKTIGTIQKIISVAEKKKKCVLCLVTGEPGAGKTLVGLQIAASRMEKMSKGEGRIDEDGLIRKVMLSGNYPLVKVIKESLVRNYYGRLKACLDLMNKDGKPLSDMQKDFVESSGFKVVPTGKKKRINGELVETQELKTVSKFTSKGKTETKKEDEKLEERRLSKTFVEATVSSMIQMVSHFRRGWELSVNPPVENVFVFDEAQRAWSFDQVKKKDKNTHPDQISREWSEPRTLLEYLNRHSKSDGWCVAIALVGHGQDIHEGEAGIEEWYKALKNSKNLEDWIVCGHDKTELSSKGFVQEVNPDWGEDIDYDKLYLKDMQRSFKAKDVGPFVNALLKGKEGVEEAKVLLERIQETFPLYVTQAEDIGVAKKWLAKVSNNGRRRCGSVMSSRAARLRAYGFHTLAQGFDEATWFLEPSDNINSSSAIEISATEFKIQGLELDYVLVGWDGDLLYNPAKGVFEARHFSLKANTWKEVKGLNADDETGKTDGESDDEDVDPKDKDRHLRNAYRVLLTRARQGMVIFVPKGTPAGSDQVNLSHDNYDETYKFLHVVIGIKELADEYKPE